MGSTYENSEFMLSTVALKVNDSQHKGKAVHSEHFIQKLIFFIQHLDIWYAFV